MQDEFTNVAVMASITLTLIAIFKRFHTFTNPQEFELEFDGEILNPQFLIFSIVAAVSLMAPTNYIVGQKTYRNLSGFYENVVDRKAFLRDLESRPITTLATNKKDRITRHLDIPIWLSSSLSSFAKVSLTMSLIASLTLFCVALKYLFNI